MTGNGRVATEAGLRCCVACGITSAAHACALQGVLQRSLNLLDQHNEQLTTDSRPPKASSAIWRAHIVSMRFAMDVQAANAHAYARERGNKDVGSVYHDPARVTQHVSTWYVQFHRFTTVGIGLNSDHVFRMEGLPPKEKDRGDYSQVMSVATALDHRGEADKQSTDSRRKKHEDKRVGEKMMYSEPRDNCGRLCGRIVSPFCAYPAW